MKRHYLLLIFILIFMVILAVSIKPIIRSTAQKQLENVFVGSEVSIESCSFSPFRHINLHEVRIKKDGIYHIKLKNADAYYSPSSIIQKNILRIVLKDADIEIDMPKKSISHFTQHLSLGSEGLFSMRALELLDFRLNFNSKDFNIQAQASFGLSPADQTIKFIDVKVSSFDGYKIVGENGSLKINKDQDWGDIAVGSIQYNKVKIKNINGTASIDNNILSIKSLFAQIFDGQITGDGTLTIGQVPQYYVSLKFLNLDLEKFINDFELDEKFQMTGVLSGHLVLNGNGGDINILNGDFFMAEKGGTLIIKDTRFLENIARSSDQSFEILVESFKNYHYNNGKIKILLKQENLILDMVLDGEAGKRDLSITLHNFKPKKDDL